MPIVTKVAKSYFDKNRKADIPGRQPIIGPENEQPGVLKSPPATETNDPNYAPPSPIDTGTPPAGDGSAAQATPAASAPAAPPSIDTLNRIGEAMKSPSIVNSPLFQRIAENREKLLALEMQPTYVDKRGVTRNGMQDKNGRVQSGLKALVSGLAQVGPARDWNDLAAQLSGSISRGVTGAILPSWDENVDRMNEIQRLQKETQNLMGQAEWDSKMETQTTNRENSTARTGIAQKQLDERVARDKVNNLKDEQRMALEPILKRGYYYQGDSPDEDSKLASMKIILPDFDTTRKAVNDNGVKKAWDPTTRSYKQMQGTEVDPDDEPITFMADGEKITASRKNYLSYKAPIVASQVAADQKTTEVGYKAGQDDAELQGRIQAANKSKSAAEARLKEIAGLTGLPKIQAQDEVEKLNKEIREAESDIAGFEARRKALPKPPVFKGRSGGQAAPSAAKDPLGLFK